MSLETAIVLGMGNITGFLAGLLVGYILLRVKP